MNWGYKILLVYIIFVAGIGVLIYKSTGINTDLVTTDYYEKELKYQQKIDEMKRTNALSSTLQCKVDNNQIVILFPEEMKGKETTANILLYCPSDKKKDISLDSRTSDGSIKMPINPQNKGAHELKVSWQTNGLSYYSEEKLFIQ